MRVLVTGGTGFVGSHTVAAVKSAGHEAKLFVRDPARIGPALGPHGLSTRDLDHAVGDVNDVAAVRRAIEGCDAVIHAGSVYAYNLPFWKARALMTTNVEGTANVLRAARDMRLDPIVYVSTSWAIVQSTPAVLTEDSPIGHPPDAYPRSKARAEGIARQMQEEGVPVVITYPPGVWGPHDPYWGETAQLAEMILRGRLPFIPDGTSPFCDVREVARLHAAVLEPSKGPRRYLVPSHSPRFSDVVRLVAAAAGRDIKPVRIPDRAALWPARAMLWAQAVAPFRMPIAYAGPWYVTRNNVYAESRAQKALGITPRPFEESIGDTVRWMAATGRLKA